MRLKLHFKTPDVVDNAIHEEIQCLRAKGVDEDSLACYEEDMRGALEKYINFGEEITVEIDCDTKKAEVLRAR